MGWMSSRLACAHTRLSRHSRLTEDQTPTSTRSNPPTDNQRPRLLQRCHDQFSRVARQCWPADATGWSPAEPRRCWGLEGGTLTPDSENDGDSGGLVTARNGGAGGAAGRNREADASVAGGSGAAGDGDDSAGGGASSSSRKQHRRSHSKSSKSVDWSLTPCNSVADFADLKMVGRGRWATVFAATHCRSGRRVVLKIYSARHQTAAMQKQVEREIWCMRQTRGHKHAIGFLGSFVDDASKIESAIDANSRGGGKGKNR
ncbi:unnamed protein product, partial [Closterium sp. NIES-54]